MSSSGPRVHELARELGLTSNELIQRLRELSPDAPVSPSATVPSHLVDSLRSAAAPDRLTAPSTEPADGQLFVLAAFGDARAKGIEDWRRMQAGVMKNRLLNLTDRSFDERQWGVAGFLDFVGLFPSLVQIDRTTRPPAIDLLVQDEGAVEEALTKVLHSMQGRASYPAPRTGIPPGGSWRIRRDLWLSVLDYGKEQRWVWDEGAAVAVAETELASEDRRPPLPTVKEEELRTWRQRFKDTHEKADPAVAEALREWHEGQETSWSLPPAIRSKWFDTLKLLVRDRLIRWFESNGIPIPSDFIEMPEAPERRGLQRDIPTEELRRAVIRCIQAMTREELEDLRLPASLLVRTRETR